MTMTIMSSRQSPPRGARRLLIRGSTGELKSHELKTFGYLYIQFSFSAHILYIYVAFGRKRISILTYGGTISMNYTKVAEQVVVIAQVKNTCACKLFPLVFQST